MKTTCPGCGVTNNRIAILDNKNNEPVAGDVYICWRCRRLTVFDHGPLGNQILRFPYLDEEKEILARGDIRNILNIIAECYTPTEVIEILKQVNDGKARDLSN